MNFSTKPGMFDPRVLPEDKAKVCAARTRQELKSSAGYVHKSNICLFGHKTSRPDLVVKAGEWSEANDMVACTESDIVHFEAQIRLAKQQGAEARLEVCSKTLADLRERNQNAERDVGRLSGEIEAIVKEVRNGQGAAGSNGDA